MKILNVEKRKDILYEGFIEGEYYKGLINPILLGTFDCYNIKAIDIEVTLTLFEIRGKKYYTIIGTNLEGSIVYEDIQEN